MVADVVEDVGGAQLVQHHHDRLEPLTSLLLPSHLHTSVNVSLVFLNDSVSLVSVSEIVLKMFVWIKIVRKQIDKSIFCIIE